MKDEFKGKIISEFLRLKLEMYFLVDVDGEENKKENKSVKFLLKTQDIRIC